MNKTFSQTTAIVDEKIFFLEGVIGFDVLVAFNGFIINILEVVSMTCWKVDGGDCG